MKLSEKDIILFSGDSITDGNRGRSMDCNHIMGHGYQYIISSRLALDNCESRPKFINKGYSGENVIDLLEKWHEDVIVNKPTVLSILAGVNEGGYGYFNNLTPDEAEDRYETNLRKILALTRKELGDIHIFLCEPFYFPLDKSDYSYRYTPHCDGVEKHFVRPDSNDPVDSVNYRFKVNERVRAAAKRAAEDFNCIFVPLHDVICEYASKTRIEYLVWDGTHPTIAGHMLIAEQWLKAAESYLK